MATKVKGVAASTQHVPQYIEKQLLAVEMVDVGQLTVDHNYQREEDAYRINKMVREWDWQACGHLAVSLRKGRKNSYYAVIDGQQRLSAIRQMGYDEAPCRIYVDLSPVQEAELYEKLNDNKKPTYNDLFKSRIARKESNATDINVAVESVGYHLDFDRKRAGSGHSAASHFFIQTMSEMDKMYNAGGIQHIIDVLKFVKSVFPGEPLGHQAMILSGVSLFIRRYPEANRTELMNKIRSEGQTKLVQNGLGWKAVQGIVGNNGTAFCEAMLISYNRNRQENNRIKSRA